MRKHNEGYSLVLVLVVLIVLGLLASFILSFSLRNLQSQQASVERMQDRYTAEGEIEKTIAELETLIADSTREPVLLENAVVSEIDSDVIEITVSSGAVQINYELKLIEGAFTEDKDNKTVTVTTLTGVEYVTYDISTAEEVGGE